MSQSHPPYLTTPLLHLVIRLLHTKSQTQLLTIQPCLILPCYATTPTHKKPVTSPYYTTMTSPHHAPSPYSQLEHYSAPTIAPIKRSASDNCLNIYETIYPQHQKDENSSDNLKPSTQAELHHK